MTNLQMTRFFSEMHYIRRGWKSLVTGISLAVFLSTAFLARGSGQSIGTVSPSNGQVAAVVAGMTAIVGTVAVVSIVHSKHTKSGCVISSDQGLNLITGDSHTYRLEGELTNIHAGDKVKLHGKAIKKAKGDEGYPAFRVQSLKKHYGACKPAP